MLSPVLIHPRDDVLDEDEWRTFVLAQGFGHLVAGGGPARTVPVVVPTQFTLSDDARTVELHLQSTNPIFEALAEEPTVLLSVAGDWAYVPSAWKVIGDEDPRRGIPTTYYAAAQLVGAATVVSDPDEVAEVLRHQMADVQPGIDVVDPTEHGPRLRQIRGLRIEVAEVRAKFKYGGNVDEPHRLAVADHLAERDGPGDAAARSHQLRRTEVKREQGLR
jgi:transcriptional regulator